MPRIEVVSVFPPHHPTPAAPGRPPIHVVRLLTLLAICALAVLPPARAAPPVVPELPAVRVRLESLGACWQATLRGDRATSLPSNSSIPIPDAGLEVSVSRGRVSAGGALHDSLRLEGESISLQVGRLTRHYPDALLLTATPRGLSLVNEAGMERYLEGVVGAECPALFHPEAIRAQAVAARSYSYRKAYFGAAELDDTTRCQVYLGVGGVRPQIRDAVRATSGLCALYQGEVIDAVYSADCGGRTESSESAWRGGKVIPYLRSVVDAPSPESAEYCSVNRSHVWKSTITWSRLRSLAGKAVRTAAEALRLKLLEFSESGRVAKLLLGPASALEAAVPRAGADTGSRLFRGEEWRNLLGPSVVRSLRFEVRATPEGLVLTGRGYGHGVGLCQYGANGMAKAGAGFQEILTHYYTGAEVAPAPAPVTPGLRPTPRTPSPLTFTP